MDTSSLIILIISIIAIGYSIYIIIYEQRSLKSKLFEEIIKLSGYKKIISKEANIRKEIEKKLKSGEQHYKFPKLPLKSKISKHKYKTIDYYSFNNEGLFTIFYLHGGSYFDNPLFLHIEFLDNLSKSLNCKIILPIYPKIPFHEHNYSQSIIYELYNKLATNESNIVLMGDSAGGGFCMSLSYLLRDNKCIMPSNIILLSPWLDVSMSNKDIIKYEKLDPQLSINSLKVMGKLWSGYDDVKDPLVSPLYGNFNKLSPITLFIGTHELLLPDARLFKTKCIKNSIKINYFEYKNMNHVFLLQPIPESKKAIEEIKKILC